MKTLCLILPSYNEAKVIGKVIDKLNNEIIKFSNLKTTILVVDDGSSDKTEEICNQKKVKYIKHFINRGLGAALATGLEYTKINNYDFALTFDSDGQHDPKDIIKTVKPLLGDQADVVIGSRLKGQKGMPLDRIIINSLSNFFTFLLFNIWTSDSQSGFRVFNHRALQSIKIKTQGMEVSSEFFAEIKRNKLRLQEVPINVIYTKYSRQKGQNNLNSVRIITRLLYRIFR